LVERCAQGPELSWEYFHYKELFLLLFFKKTELSNPISLFIHVRY
jgi:hypothetical protein